MPDWVLEFCQQFCSITNVSIIDSLVRSFRFLPCLVHEMDIGRLVESVSVRRA